ncbi:MerR family transcriptional regulator [uncultured Sphingomonas sp.]|uniref:MerR family transcriptional regulator n=1 Tax=uncultured Sphingomonas sp. TaxID=158754 RepID=UPI0035CC1758
MSRDTGVPPHVLRYWETRFLQLRPVVRAGQRRYYRPEDVALVRRIDALLNGRGYTIRGVQKLLEDGDDAPAPAASIPTISVNPIMLDSVRRIRDALAAALSDD